SGTGIRGGVEAVRIARVQAGAPTHPRGAEPARRGLLRAAQHAPLREAADHMVPPRAGARLAEGLPRRRRGVRRSVRESARLPGRARLTIGLESFSPAVRLILCKQFTGPENSQKQFSRGMI